MASFLVVAAVIWWLLRPAGLRIPAMLAASLPVNCEQVVLVLATEEHSQNARLWRMERTAGREWKPVGAATAVTWGHQGLAWGTGEHTDQPPTGFRIKREGDKCSPAGVFCIPFAFGLAPASEASWLKLPYIPLTPSLVGVDDPKSMHYNQVVDSTKVERDWDSNEPMARHQRLYHWGAFIANNPEGRPGLGSCIFFHLWPGPGLGTAGCTAMAEEDLKTLLAWLDPAKEPRLVQGIEGW